MELSKDLNLKIEELRKRRLALKRLIDGAEATRVKIEGLEKRNSSLTVEVTRLMAEGKDSSKPNRESRENRIELEEARALLKELSETAVPLVKKTVEEVEAKIRIELREKILSVKAEQTSRLDAALGEALKVVRSYREEIVSSLNEIDVHFDPQTTNELLMLWSKNPEFIGWLRATGCTGVGVL